MFHNDTAVSHWKFARAGIFFLEFKICMTTQHRNSSNFWNRVHSWSYIFPKNKPLFQTLQGDLKTVHNACDEQWINTGNMSSAVILRTAVVDIHIHIGDAIIVMKTYRLNRVLQVSLDHLFSYCHQRSGGKTQTKRCQLSIVILTRAYRDKRTSKTFSRMTSIYKLALNGYRRSEQRKMTLTKSAGEKVELQ